MITRLAPRTVAALVCGGVIFLHFQVALVGGYPLTCALPLTAFIFALCFRARLPPLAVAAVMLLLLLPLVIFAISGDTTSLSVFPRTYALWCFATILLTIASRAPLNPYNLSGIVNGAFAALIIVVAMSISQIILARAGIFWAYNPWRSHQYFYEYSVTNQFSVLRAPAFYLEPSYNALVMVTLGFFLLMLGHRRLQVLLLTGIGLLFARSAAGLLAFPLLAGLLITSEHRLGKRGRTPLYIISGLAVTSLGASYLISRVRSFTVPGSSANYRVVAPLDILRPVLVEHPLGLPLGTVNETVRQADLLNGSTVGGSLDNGFYVIIYYFGWVAIIIGVLSLLTVLLTTGNHTRASRLLFVGYCLVFLVFSGAIFVPENVLLACLVIIAWRASLLSRQLVAKFAPSA